ncbi:undecaprenyl/decaprenyl-phosphate alpha-N-acetylglucosaminyl 1-phosphate transferase [Candidatus Curtissbacteria bacterium]|nr:undecaprenyl/decaprenyl-phosphate alpha-N-acetylglucosaminyl 1-phosphate transferase [Candidatus Curtissbacteria bacterium]
MTFLLVFLVSFSFSVLFTPITIYLAKKFGYVDDPEKHKHPAVLHKTIIPRAGGLALFCSFFLAALLFVGISGQLLGIFAGGLILVLAGLIDDRRELNKGLRLFAQILAAIVVVGSGVGIAFITNPIASVLPGDFSVLRLDTLRIVFDFWGPHSILVLADLFAVLWIVWVINMVNFSSGVDGQMPGIVFIALIVLFLVSLKYSYSDPTQLMVSLLSLIGAAVTLGFLVFNFAPARIFPGDSGSYFLGFLVAVLAILSGAKVGTAVLVMVVPLTDGVFTIIRRLSSKKSPLVGDRGHLHHKLLSLGLSQRQVALFYWILCAILGAIALNLNSTGKVFAILIIGIIVLGGLIWLHMTLPIKGQK